VSLSRFRIIQFHALLAAFFLPFGVLFFITGALYTVERTGSYATTSHAVPLTAPLAPDLDALAALATARLAEAGIAPPTGAMRVRKVGTSFAFEWSGANRDVVLAPTADPALAKMEVKDTTWYRRLVQLHKAKGGPVFKAFAVATATALLLLFLSGTLLAWRHRALRPLSTAAFLAGLAAFAGAVYLS
jgi:hypothetical protein